MRGEGQRPGDTKTCEGAKWEQEVAGKEGKTEDKVRTVERGSIYSIHPEPTWLYMVAVSP